MGQQLSDPLQDFGGKYSALAEALHQAIESEERYKIAEIIGVPLEWAGFITLGFAMEAAYKRGMQAAYDRMAQIAAGHRDGSEMSLKSMDPLEKKNA